MEFTWKYCAGFYNKNNLPAKATRTWVTKTIFETDSAGTTHYVTKLLYAYMSSDDGFYIQNGKAVLSLGTLTVEVIKASNGYLLDDAYMQVGEKYFKYEQKVKLVNPKFTAEVTQSGIWDILNLY